MNVPGVAVRGCRLADLADVCRVEETCYGREDALHRIALTQYFDLCGPAFALAEISSEIVGFAVGGLALGDKRLGWLLDVAILPSFQGRGIGQAVCGYALDQLAVFGIKTVRATVAPHNDRSFKMLRRLDFSVMDEIADYFGPGQSRLLLERHYKD